MFGSSGPSSVHPSSEDAGNYVSQLLTSGSLQQLLSVSNALDEQVQHLDSAVQTLVYNNYSEFLSAADTVKSLSDMKQTQPNEATEMESLLNSTLQMFQPLQSNARKVQELERLNRLLAGLQRVFRLPKKMETLISNREFASALTHFLNSQKFLLQCRHQSPFKDLHAQCYDLSLQAKQALTSCVVASPSQSITDTIQLLGKAWRADEESRSASTNVAPRIGSVEEQRGNGNGSPSFLLSLWRDACLQELQRCITSISLEASSGLLFNMVEGVSDVVLPKIELWVASVDSTFESVGRELKDEEIQNTVSKLVNSSLSLIFSNLLAVAATEGVCSKSIVVVTTTLRQSLLTLRASHPSEVSESFLGFLFNLTFSGIISKFEATMKLILEQHLTPLLQKAGNIKLPELGVASQTEFLDPELLALLSQCSEVGQTLTVTVATTVTECDVLISEVFTKASSATRGQLARVVEAGVVSVMEFFAIYAHSLLGENLSTFYDATRFTTTPGPSSADLGQQRLARRYSKIISLSSALPYRHLSLMGLVLLLRWLDAKGVAKLTKLLAESFPQTQLEGRESMSLNCQKVSEELLAEVTCRWGRELEHKFSTEFEKMDWSHWEDYPATVSPCFRNLAIQIGTVEHILRRLLGPSTAVPIRPTTFSHLRADRHIHWTLLNKHDIRPSLLFHFGTHLRTSNALSSAMVDVDKIIGKKGAIAATRMTDVGWCASLMQIERVLCRGVLEKLRDTVFSEAGAKQLQVDVSWFRDVLKEHLVCSRRGGDEGRAHSFGYALPPRQASVEDLQFRHIGVLIDEMILSATSLSRRESDKPDGSEFDDVVILFVPFEELDIIITREGPV